MTPTLHGFCDERFAQLREAFAQNFADGFEVGASLAVIHHGQPVVDLWAGFRDAERTLPWQRDTITSVASTTKLTAAISFLLLIDRGTVDLDAPIARYWPEFAAGGKSAVTVRDALTHRAGVPGFASQIPFATFKDCAAITARIAAEPHWFAGERRICYHFYTYGYILGELIRRIDGRDFPHFFTQEIAQRANVDFQFGLLDFTELARCALPVHAPDLFDMFAAGGFAQKLFDCVAAPENAADRLLVQNPGGSGFGSARALARAGAIIANRGTFEGVRFLSPETVALAGSEQVYGSCPYIGPVRFGLGFGLHSEEFPFPSTSMMGWGGLGGSFLIMDPDLGVSVAYAPNYWMAWRQPDGEALAPDQRGDRLFTALRTVLDGFRDTP